MKYICLTFLLITNLYAKDVLYQRNFDCITLNQKVYTGSPDSLGGRFNRDGVMTYIFSSITLKGIGEPDFTKAKSLKIRYWNPQTKRFKTDNILGAMKKTEKTFPLIGKKEKKKVETIEEPLGKQK